MIKFAVITTKKDLHPFNKTQYSLIAVTLLLSLSTYAAADPNNQQTIHQQQQQKAREQQLGPETPDVRFDVQTEAADILNFPQEKRCFQINKVELQGLDTMPKWLRLQYLAAKGQQRCLRGEGINLLMSALQNKLINSGYITSRILAPEQDLRSGTLKLLLLPGKVRHISATMESDRYLTLFNTVPSREGNLLDLRDIEQGLENLQRIPTAQAEINLMPGEQPGESDVVISWKQKKHWRIAASLDDSGTISTGRYQGGLTLYLDNPTSIGDMFYISGGHDLRGSNEKGNRNYTMNYLVPLGYWSFSSTLNGNNYHQRVFGNNVDYEYSGRSRSISIRLSRILHRNASWRTSAFYEITRKNSQNYINDTEVKIQRRNTSAWKLGLQHRHYFQHLTFDSSVDYQRGVRWFGAQAAPEEKSREATALVSIIHLSASLDVPFAVFGQQFSYSPSYQQQISRNRLTNQDRFSIGGRWTVRGFDGELSLSADNGWYWRNDLNWLTPLPNQYLYTGVDYGEVSGNYSKHQIGQRLMGGVVGTKGYIDKLNLSYDGFAGIPISKPKGFKTNPVTLGFNLFWEY